MKAAGVVRQLFAELQLPWPGDERLSLSGSEPALPSSFAIGTAAQSSMAAAALAASEYGRMAGGPATVVSSNMRHAALECCSHFAIDGVAPNLWDKFSGLYETADGFVRMHTNFAHHRDGALAILGLEANTANKADVQNVLRTWAAVDFETVATERGLVVSKLRSRAEWLAHPQAQFVQNLRLVHEEVIQPAHSKIIAKNVIKPQTSGLNSSKNTPNRPLEGLKVLELTRILAGPVCGRTLAAYGAEVMLINGPHLPNIDAIADTSRGKRSAQLDLRTALGKATLRALVAEADVFVQGYRPGGLEALGFGPQALAEINPRIVAVTLSAYGHAGPWAHKRGFDSLVQTATGFNTDEQAAAGTALPQTLPAQILDYATGHLMAFAAIAGCIKRNADEAPTAKHMRLSLARTGEWLRSLGRLPDGFAAPKPNFAGYVSTDPSGFGALTALNHAVGFNGMPATWRLPSMPPGSHLAAW